MTGMDQDRVAEGRVADDESERPEGFAPNGPPYEPPAITDLGPLSQLTLGANQTSGNDMNQAKKSV